MKCMYLYDFPVHPRLRVQCDHFAVDYGSVHAPNLQLL